MKVTSSVSKPVKMPPPKIEFPVLMRWQKTGTEVVVLFTSEEEGTVVHSRGSRHSHHKIGHHTSHWVSCFDSSVWEPFIRPVTLQNKFP